MVLGDLLGAIIEDSQILEISTSRCRVGNYWRGTRGDIKHIPREIYSKFAQRNVLAVGSRAIEDPVEYLQSSILIIIDGDESMEAEFMEERGYATIHKTNEACYAYSL